MIEPIPGQIIKDQWENTPHPMQSPTYLMMLKLGEVIQALNEHQHGYYDFTEKKGALDLTTHKRPRREGK